MATKTIINGDEFTILLATDYAAIEAERDEWKRRCEAMLAIIEEAKGEFAGSCDAYTRALAIAEGRDNG